MGRWLAACEGRVYEDNLPVEVPGGLKIIGGARLGVRVMVVAIPVEFFTGMGPETYGLLVAEVEKVSQAWCVARAARLLAQGYAIPDGYCYLRGWRDGEADRSLLGD